MDRITDDLYVGDIRDAGEPDRLREGEPTAVLQLTHGDPAEPYPSSLTVRSVPMIDGPQNDFDDFARATETLLRLLDDDHVVFVHCSAGVSRSGSVSAAALAVRHGIDFRDALERVQDRRPVVSPHSHLREQGERFVEAY